MPCGAPKDDGTRCQQPAGWGTDRSEGPCKYHEDDNTARVDGQSGHDGHADDLPYGELQIRRILDALEDGASYEIAARAAGISPRTFRRWRNRYDDLRERVQRAEAESAGDALGVVQQAASEGDWRAASWLLERRHGYHTGGDELADEDKRQFVETVQDVLRNELADDKAAHVMAKIGNALEELDRE